MTTTQKADVLIVGGGFYGCCIALRLKQEDPHRRILIIERSGKLLGRASYVNQARVHNGYHYPRSFTTAFRSRVNFRRFISEYEECVDDTFTKIYAIARRNSLVTSNQFERFCREIQAPLRTPQPHIERLFSPSLIEAVYEVDEIAFDAAKLARRMAIELEKAGVDIWMHSTVTGVDGSLQRVTATVRTSDGDTRQIEALRLFNCTYAGINHLGGGMGRIATGIKYEITELALVAMPDELAEIGVTVMDGPFFSAMPFPDRALHSLSHVRYTPHLNWTSLEYPDLDPYDVLDGYEKRSRVGHMIRDAARYIPALSRSKPHDALFEIKAVLMRNEVDDGRPILVEEHRYLRGVITVLGGKIDNIFDVIEILEKEKINDYV